MFKSRQPVDSRLSQLYDQHTFDAAFMNDLRNCNSSLLIESPFIRLNRISTLLPFLTKLQKRGIHIIINTRNPLEHDLDYQQQAEQAIAMLQDLGVLVLYTVKHHRKLAIIDRTISWEGSLNILSYYDSCEIMRRNVSALEAEILLNFIGMQENFRNN
jgi:phosphatidylserine/phosphatidylglycerophosphate/cardiolipin synthase-like enzyme